MLRQIGLKNMVWKSSGFRSILHIPTISADHTKVASDMRYIKFFVLGEKV
jgi:hypothetical protein